MSTGATNEGTRAALELRQVSKAFGGKRALEKISLSVGRGSFTVILGAAGAGKTTLLRTIAGLEKPESGDVFIGADNVTGLEPKDRDIALIFDNLALYPNKTGFENIANPLRIEGLDRPAIEAKVQEIAATLRIAHVLARLPKTMSGGERQRVALGRSLVRKPRLFLLDEPLSSLDAMLRIDLRAELRRLQREFGFTFIMATPDYAEAMAVADTIVTLREGRVIQIDDPQTLYEEPSDWDVARFVGSPEINLLPARYTPSGGGRILMEGVECRAPAALRCGHYLNPFSFRAGVRPEHFKLERPGDGQWRGTVTDIEPLGSKAVVTVRLKDHEVRVLVAASSLHLRGDETTGLSFDEGRLIAFDDVTKVRLP